MHAVHARRRGYHVVHLEREPEARGASVRNFGLVWVSGRKAGPELALALRARQLWKEISAEVPGTGPPGRVADHRDRARLSCGLWRRRSSSPTRPSEASSCWRPTLSARSTGAARRLPGRPALRADGIARPGWRCPRCGPGSRAVPATNGCPVARPSRSSRTACGTTPAPGTAVTSTSSAPARTTRPAGPAPARHRGARVPVTERDGPAPRPPPDAADRALQRDPGHLGR